MKTFVAVVCKQHNFFCLNLCVRTAEFISYAAFADWGLARSVREKLITFSYTPLVLDRVSIFNGTSAQSGPLSAIVGPTVILEGSTEEKEKNRKEEKRNKKANGGGQEAGPVLLEEAKSGINPCS